MRKNTARSRKKKRPPSRSAANDDWRDHRGFLLILYGGISLLSGGLAFRSCLTDVGWGNTPGNAIPAGLATGMLAFAFALIMTDFVPPRIRIWILAGIISLLIGIHVFGFH